MKAEIREWEDNVWPQEKYYKNNTSNIKEK